jgi:magnesium chelatase accessory protein
MGLVAEAASSASAASGPAWEREGRDWPLREHSVFVDAAGLRWHLQRLGSGPVLLLVHGTGSATHTWRDLAPLLAKRFTVIAPDLPGHGFTRGAGPGQLSLPGMAHALARLLETLGVSPEIAVGHSAGAAVVLRMCLDGALSPRLAVSLNGALLPFGGVPGRVFSPLARLMAANPLAAQLVAWHGRDAAAVARLLRATGSRLDARAVELYRRLVSHPGHVAGTLGMMARWDLHALGRDLARLATPLVLVTADNDRTVSPREATQVVRRLPAATHMSLAGLGHLAHEERPEMVAALILRLAGAATGAPQTGGDTPAGPSPRGAGHG